MKPPSLKLLQLLHSFSRSFLLIHPPPPIFTHLTLQVLLPNILLRTRLLHQLEITPQPLLPARRNDNNSGKDNTQRNSNDLGLIRLPVFQQCTSTDSLNLRRRRRKHITKLIDRTRKPTPKLRRRVLVEQDRHDAPRAILCALKNSPATSPPKPEGRVQSGITASPK